MAITGVSHSANAYGVGRADQRNGATAKAQNYLKELQEKYPNVNVTVADLASEKQSDAYMLGSRGYNNLAISSCIVEKMASDPAAAAKYEKVFVEMSNNGERVERFARENNDEILGAGAVIDKNGKVSYWMVGRSKDTVENPGTAYKEKVQRQIAEKRQKKKEEEALKEKRLAKAESIEKMMGQRRAQAGQPAKAQEEGKGAQMDLTI